MSTLEALQSLLAEEFRVDRAQIEPDTELAALGVDSLDMLDLMFKIEDRFGLKIQDDTPPSMRTLNDVVLYVDSLLARPSGERSHPAGELHPLK